MVIEIKTVVTLGGQRGLMGKGHMGIFWNDGNVYLYTSVGCMAFVKTHLCILIYVNYTSINNKNKEGT